MVSAPPPVLLSPSSADPCVESPCSGRFVAPHEYMHGNRGNVYGGLTLYCIGRSRSHVQSSGSQYAVGVLVDVEPFPHLRHVLRSVNALLPE